MTFGANVITVGMVPQSGRGAELGWYAAVDSPRRDQALMQTHNRRTCGSDKQRWQQRVDHTRDSASNHGHTELQRMALVLPITLPERTRVVREKAIPETGSGRTPKRR
jgi:hypothetical protein